MQHPARRDQVEAALDVPQLQEIAVQETDGADVQVLRHARGIGEAREAQVHREDPELRLAQRELDGFVAGSAAEHQGPGSGSERARRLPVGEAAHEAVGHRRTIQGGDVEPTRIGCAFVLDPYPL